MQNWVMLQPKTLCKSLSLINQVMTVLPGAAGDSMAPMQGYNTIAPPGFDATASSVSVSLSCFKTRGMLSGTLCSSMVQRLQGLKLEPSMHERCSVFAGLPGRTSA